MELNSDKAIQAAAVLLREDHCEEMSYLRLIKLLYIADRESLAETGRPIVGDRFVAMEHGPVLSGLLDIIRDEDSRSSEWRKFFRREKYRILLENDPGVGKLSRYDIRKLQEVARRHAEDDVWAIVQHTHTFAEWKRNNPGKSSKEIPLADILEAVGKGDEAQRIIQELDEQAALTRWAQRRTA